MPSTPKTIYPYALFLACAIGLMGLALGTHDWLIVKIPLLGDVHLGLFKFCFQDECVSTDNFDLYLQMNFSTVAALCIIGIVLYTLASFVGLYLVFILKLEVMSRNTGVMSFAFGVIGAIFAWSAVGRFTTEIQVKPGFEWRYGYSFYVAAVSGVLSVLAVVLIYVTVSSLLRDRLQGQSGSGIIVSQNQLAQIPTVSQPGAQYAYPGVVNTSNNYAVPNPLPAAGYRVHQVPQKRPSYY